jgi:hypothetical protein
MPFSTSMVGAALLGAMIFLSPAVASAQTLTSIWRDFYQGCAQDEEHRQLCACAATEFIQRCQGLGSGSPVQVAQCVQRNQDAWLDPVVELCHGYGALHVAGPVATPTPRAVSGRGATMSQDAVWSAAYEGCEPNMTPGAHREYACACVASYVVQTCAASGSVPARHVSSCVPAMRSEIERVTPLCSQFGALATGAAPVTAATAPAPPAAPTHPVAVQLCNELEDLPDPTQRLECARVMTTVTSSDVQAFLGYLPSAGRVRLFRDAGSNPAAVRAHFARNRGLEVVFSGPRPAVYVIPGASPQLVLLDSDVVDAPAPEARFRWNAQTVRWELVSIDYASE